MENPGISAYQIALKKRSAEKIRNRVNEENKKAISTMLSEITAANPNFKLVDGPVVSSVDYLFQLFHRHREVCCIVLSGKDMYMGLEKKTARNIHWIADNVANVIMEYI